MRLRQGWDEWCCGRDDGLRAAVDRMSSATEDSITGVARERRAVLAESTPTEGQSAGPEASAQP